MNLTTLELSNFRNYKRQSVTFSDGLNVVCGKNAQGKTNLLEAVYLLSTGGSSRVSSDKEMILFGEERARVYGEAKTNSGEISIEMILSRSEKKRASVNGLAIARIGELFSNINAVYFSPDEMRLIKNSPDYRRKFMDVVLSQLSRSYFYVLGKYNKVLKQRNSLLKCGDKKTMLETLEIWDIQLAEFGAKIVAQRNAFCKMLSESAREVHKELARDEALLDISYQSVSEKEDLDKIASCILFDLEKTLEKDIRLGYTTTGVQKDDIKIALGDIDIRTYGSQGQQRTATLALKLAEVEIFENLKKDKPILLLDDVLSELDDARQACLMKKAKNLQTIITTTSNEWEKLSDKTINIEAGKVIK